MAARLTTILTLAASVGGAPASRAEPAAPGAEQDPACERPPIKQLRYEEDYAFLRDPACRTDLWDPVKYIPLSRRFDVYLTLGAHLRERYEYYRNPGWGEGPNDAYLLSRFMVHGDLHVGSRLRVFAELASQFVNGRAGGPGPVDEDLLDLHHGFFDASAEIPRAGRFTLRGGRQELDYVSSRLIAVREGANVRLSFDGLRAIQRVGAWRIDAFALAPVEVDPGVFDDGPESGTRLWGAYSFGPVIGEALALDLYYLGLRRTEAAFEQGTARERRHSFGVRISGTPADVDYNFELVYQLGAFGAGNIRAWTIASDNGYTFASLPWSPRLGAQVNATSGDGDPLDLDLQTFNPLFPRASYFSEARLIGPLNHIDVHPVLELRPVESLVVAVAWDAFWRESLDDGVYLSSGALQVPGAGNPERYIGGEAVLQISWMTRHLIVVAAYSHFFAGPFLREAGRDHDIDFVTLWASYRL